MSPDKFLHGTSVLGLTELIPGLPGSNPNHPCDVFATTEIGVAAMFTLSQGTVSFMIDPQKKRIFIPDANEFLMRNNGGAIYQVRGDFRPASDRKIFEYSAPGAVVVNEIPVVDTGAFLAYIGFTLFADPDLFAQIIRHWNATWRFPNEIPEDIRPLNR